VSYRAPGDPTKSAAARKLEQLAANAPSAAKRTEKSKRGLTARDAEAHDARVVGHRVSRQASLLRLLRDMLGIAALVALAVRLVSGGGSSVWLACGAALVVLALTVASRSVAQRALAAERAWIAALPFAVKGYEAALAEESSWLSSMGPTGGRAWGRIAVHVRADAPDDAMDTLLDALRAVDPTGTAARKDDGVTFTSGLLPGIAAAPWFHRVVDHVLRDAAKAWTVHAVDVTHRR
jgi:hypothetical protein